MIHVEAKHLSVEFQMRRTGERMKAIQDMSFTAQPGKFVCIVGTSGCGKTTLLKLVAGLLTPSSGQILLGGIPVVGPGKERAMVFQSAALLPWRTVLRNVTYGLELQGISLKEARKEARLFKIAWGRKSTGKRLQ